MRLPRIKAEGPAFYHCVSRVVEGRFIFQTTAPGSVEAEYFVGLMRRLEAFSGVQVLTYALMSNHFHVLCQVPQGEPVSELELLERIEAGYGQQRRQALERQLARWSEQAQGASQRQQLLEPYRRRMNDLSVFFKELKGRFAQWYNRRHERYGVLWAERFKSVLLEGGQAVAAVGAYIELNPVRAGLCADPKDTATAAMLRRWPGAVPWPRKGSEAFWVSQPAFAGRKSAGSIAGTSSSRAA